MTRARTKKPIDLAAVRRWRVRLRGLLAQSALANAGRDAALAKAVGSVLDVIGDDRDGR